MTTRIEAVQAVVLIGDDLRLVLRYDPNNGINPACPFVIESEYHDNFMLVLSADEVRAMAKWLQRAIDEVVTPNATPLPRDENPEGEHGGK